MKNDSEGMTIIAKTITRLTVGLILIYGIYIVLAGHISPGGGFAGGIIIALSFIHLMLAFGKKTVLKKIDQTKGFLLASAGMAAFLFFSSLNFTGRHLYTHPEKEYFKIFGAGFIPLYEIVISVLVGAGLFVVFLALVLSAKEGQEK